ncbi:MAG: hypothetical protein ACP5HS_01075 [Anaerolineae bacterium]
METNSGEQRTGGPAHVQWALGMVILLVLVLGLPTLGLVPQQKAPPQTTAPIPHGPTDTPVPAERSALRGLLTTHCPTFTQGLPYPRVDWAACGLQHQATAIEGSQVACAPETVATLAAADGLPKTQAAERGGINEPTDPVLGEQTPSTGRKAERSPREAALVALTPDATEPTPNEKPKSAQVVTEPVQSAAPNEHLTGLAGIFPWPSGPLPLILRQPEGLESDIQAAEDVEVVATRWSPQARPTVTPEPVRDSKTVGPHLGYGVNVRYEDRIDPLVEPLGFDWVKLWEEYSGLPDAPLDQKVLYNINCGGHVYNRDAWRERVREIVEEGEGLVQAYEICNEPNVQNANMGGIAPDPEHFTEMLCIAWEEIKKVDPELLVISGGLAPVGRIPRPWYCGTGNNCEAMDEWTFLEAMLEQGAGECMDAFGYHAYGFVTPPEQDPKRVSNGFTFRGVERLHDMLLDSGLDEMPVWLTEFNWFRDPVEDAEDCEADDSYLVYFDWHDLSAEQQADYLVRAFEYADRNWPWMQGMFVWNLDWHDYKLEYPCLHSRFYALRSRDGTYLGATTPVYEALVEMKKRPGLLTEPILRVYPQEIELFVEANSVQGVDTTVTIWNAGDGVLIWTATISPTSQFQPTLSAFEGNQGRRLKVTAEAGGLPLGVYTATLVIDAMPLWTEKRPQTIPIKLFVTPEEQPPLPPYDGKQD